MKITNEKRLMNKVKELKKEIEQLEDALLNCQNYYEKQLNDTIHKEVQESE